MGVRVGLDPLLGLVPLVGDLLGLALSALIVLEAARMGPPRRVLAVMCLNVAVDAVAGAVPVVGDLFDAAWRANERNVDLLERSLASDAAG